MNVDVTPRAFAAGLESKPAVRRLRQEMEARMALQAKLPAFATDKQHAIRRPVRAVTRHTAFHFRRRVFVNEGAAFLDVALNAGFRRRLNEARRIQSAVTAVTVRAFHQALGHPVMHRLSKLTSNRRMTRVTKIRLRSFQ